MDESGQTAIMDGPAEETQSKKQAAKPFLGIQNPILSEIVSISILIGIVFVVRSSVFSIYVIPTGSMLPTIKINDRVFANKLAYGLMLPLMDRQIVSWDEPARGDIVLFQSPVESDMTFVKRVVGVAGDRISFENGTLMINGERSNEMLQSDRSVMRDMGGEEDPESKELYVEQLLDIPPHYMLRNRFGGITAYESRVFQVPEGKIFLMGDNRDGSNDSRMWGFINVNEVYGRANFILYSTDPETPGFLPSFRSDRFFRSLASLAP